MPDRNFSLQIILSEENEIYTEHCKLKYQQNKNYKSNTSDNNMDFAERR